MGERIMKALANCEQGLTEEQKLQARTNIGAIGGVYVHDAGGTNPLTPDENGYVTIDLTNAGKIQSDWTEGNPAEPSYIQNKPDLSIYALKDELDPGVFIGVYTGTAETTTPYADYKSAWEDGKAVFLSYTSEGLNLLLPMEAISDDEVLFTRTVGSVSGNDYGTVINYLVSVSAVDDSYLFHSSTMGDEQVQSDWTEQDTTSKAYIQHKPSLATVATSGSYNDLSDKPTIPAAQVQSDWNQSNTSAVDYIKNKPSIPSAQVQSDWTETEPTDPAYIKHKPTLSTVATSGSYNDLSDKPTIPAAQVQSDWSQTNSQAVDYIKNKPSIPAAQVQSDWAQNDTNAVDYIKNKPAAMETKPLVAGTNIEFVSAADRVTINSSGTKIVKRSNPYSSDVPVTEMAIYDPNEDYGALVRDQNDNTIGYLAPKHYGNNDEGKVLTVVNDNGYKLEWRPQSGGSSDLKLLTEVTQNVDSGSGAYQLTVVDGNAYTLNMLVDREVQLVTNSTETVHTRIAIHNNGDSTCGGCYLTWRDEALVQHRIYLMLYNVSNSVEYFFDVYIKKVVVNGTPYVIARVTDFPCAYRDGHTNGYTTDNINFIGRDY